MRKFNKFERGVLNRLLQDYQSSDFGIKPIQFLKDTTLSNRTIKLDSRQKLITVGFNKERDKNGPTEIFNYLSLIEKLEQNGLVFLTENTWHSLNTKFLSHNFDWDYSKSHIKPNDNWDKNSFAPNFQITLPKGYFEKLTKYYDVDMFLSSELIDLISNNFETLESKTFEQAKRQTDLSYIALILSLISLTATILISYFSETNRVSIDESKLKPIIFSLKSINKELKLNNDLLRDNRDSIIIKTNNSKK